MGILATNAQHTTYIPLAIEDPYDPDFESKWTPFQAACFAEAKKWSELSSKLYASTWSGADPVDGERYRLVAKAFRSIGQGLQTEVALQSIRDEWDAFCADQQRKINEAPKLKRGPMSGCSSIHYTWASPGQLDAHVIHIRNTVHAFAERILFSEVYGPSSHP